MQNQVNRRRFEDERSVLRFVELDLTDSESLTLPGARDG